MVDGGSFSESTNIQAVNKTQQMIGQQLAVTMNEAATEFKESIEVAFNPISMRNRFEKLENRVRKPGKEDASKVNEEDELDFLVQDIQEISQQFEHRNPELQAKSLMALHARMQPEDTAEELLAKVLESYPDPSLADEALDFLIQTSSAEVADKLNTAREQLNQEKSREITAGKNIMAEAQDFAKQNLGSPTSLRELYRDITGNPREPSTLFAELAKDYPFEKMKTLIAFMFHSLGSDLRSKGPSIEPGELQRLMTETRSMQAILGVYKFFQARMGIIFSSFQNYELTTSPYITFENLAKAYMKLLLERYPSSDKLLRLAQQLGFDEDLLAEIIIFSQMRDAVRQTSPRLYRSEQHKQDVLSTFLETLEDIEEQLEEDEEKEKEESS